jgi:hypothetical protein
VQVAKSLHLFAQNFWCRWVGPYSGKVNIGVMLVWVSDNPKE